MKVIIDYIKANFLAVSVIALAVLILILSIIIISVKRKRAGRDAEYAKMFEEVPIENDDLEDIDFEDKNRTEFESCEMDWLKGERGLGGVIRTSEPLKKKSEQSDFKTEATETTEKTEKTKISDNISQISIDDFAITETANEQNTEEENMATKTTVQDKEAEKPIKPVSEKTASEKPAKTKAQPEEVSAAKKVTGKWLIKEKGEGEFVAYLQANNKEVMLTSETYASADGAKKGIATIQKNAANADNFTYYCDKNGNYFFKLKTPQNRFLCAGATYPNKSACLKSIESVKKFVDSPVSDVIEKDITIINYVPPKVKDSSDKKYSGKWVIKTVDDAYMAQLFASNGELMLSTETYASFASAKEAIDNITDNGLKGNIIMDSDKKGRYFFKIRNSQKLTLCVSETYAQLAACQSAIESVRGFLKTSKFQEN